MKKNIVIVGGSGQFGITLSKKINKKIKIIITTRNIFKAKKIFIVYLVPRPRIELETDPYHGSVIPFNYQGFFTKF